MQNLGSNRASVRQRASRGKTALTWTVALLVLALVVTSVGGLAADTHAPTFATSEHCTLPGDNGWCRAETLTYKLQPREQAGLELEIDELLLAGSAFGEPIGEDDALLGSPLIDLDGSEGVASGDPVYVGYVDGDASGTFNVGEAVYLYRSGLNASSLVQEGDIRLTNAGGLAAGTTVLAGDADSGNALTVWSDSAFPPLFRGGEDILDDLIGYYDADATNHYSDGDVLVMNLGGWGSGSDTLSIRDIYLSGSQAGTTVTASDPLLNVAIHDLNDDAGVDPHWSLIDADENKTYDPGEVVVLELDNRSGSLVFYENFEDGVAFGSLPTETASDGNEVLDIAGRALGGLTHRVDDLPPHTSVAVEYDFYTLGTWEGTSTYDGHVLEFSGIEAINTTFDSDEISGDQCAPFNCPASHLGGTGSYIFEDPHMTVRGGQQTAVYRLTGTANHTGDSVTIGYLETHRDGVEDWTLDDIRVFTDVAGLDHTSLRCGLNAIPTDSRNCWDSINTDGIHTVSAEVADNSGNVGAANETVKLDSTPPVPEINAPCGTPGNDGWCLESILLTFPASDATSGIASQSCDVDGNSFDCFRNAINNGGNFSFNHSATDVAGNSATVSERVKVDAELPELDILVTCGQQGNNGWCQEDAAVSFFWSDAISGVDTTACTFDGAPVSCGGPILVTDGIHTANITATDIAGNTNSAEIRVKVDTTPPTAEILAPCETPGNNGWCRSDVVADFSWGDEPSGIDTVVCRLDGVAIDCQVSHDLPEGTTSLEIEVTDLAGNTATASDTIQQDTVAPDISFDGQSPAPNAAGWNNETVTLSWTCTDDTSGPIVDTMWLNLTEEGENHSGTASCSDFAGHSSSDTQSPFNIDLTDPASTSSLAGTLGDNGWYTSGVEVTLSATDNLSGVDHIDFHLDDGPQTVYASPFTVSEDGAHTVKFWSTDLADNQEPDPTTSFKIDTTAPVPTINAPCTQPGSNGWCQSSVTATFSATDATSGIASTACRIDGSAVSCGGEHTLSEGTTTLEMDATDNAGNTATTSTTVKIDTTPPELAIDQACASSGDNGWCVSPVDVTFSATDATSGIASRSCSIDGSAVDCDATTTLSDGIHQILMESSDDAGNTATTNTTVRVDTAPPFAVLLSSCDEPGNEGWCLASSYGYDLNASDATSGVDTTACLVDDATADCSGVVTGEGAHTIEADVTDAAGHLTETSLELGIDSQDPTADITATCPNEGTDGWCLEPVTVTTSASDATSGLANTTCLLDGSTVDCGSFDVASEGEHTAKIIATDLAGRSAVATTTFKVDATAPQVSFSLTCPEGGANDWCRESARLAIVIEDDGSGNIVTTCDVDSTPIHCDELLEFTKQGSSTVTVVAEDDVGNQATDTIEAKVDSHPPATNVQFTCADPGTNGWCRASSADYTATANDPTSGIDGSPACRVDGASAPCSGTLETEGTHTIEIDTIDLAGNPVTFQRSLSLDSSTPTLTSLTPGQGTVALGWDAPTGPSSTSGYKVHRATASSGHFTAVMATDGSTQATDSGLSPNTTYHYQVTALGEAGESAISNTLNATTEPVPPGAPRNLTTDAAGPTEVEISWEPPATDGGDALTSYRIYRGTSSGELTHRATVPPSQSSFTDNATATDDEENTGFVYFRVNATNAVDEGAGSEEVRYPPNAPEPEPQPEPEPEEIPTEFELAWQTTEGPTIDADARAIALSPDGATVFSAGTVATPDGEQIAVTAYGAEDADRLWHTRLGAASLGPDRPTTLITSPAGDQVFVAGAFGDSYGVAALATDGGAIQWTQRLAGAGHEALALAIEEEGSLLYATGTIQDPGTGADLHTLALEASTGATAWQATYATGGQDEGGDIAYDASTGSTLVSGTSAQDAVVIAYDAATGDQQWLVRHDGGDLDLASGLALTPSQGLAHVAVTSLTPEGHEGRILSYDIATGQLAWSQALVGGQADLPAGALVPTALTSDATTGVLFLASEVDDAEAGGIRRAVHALIPETGQVQWSRALDASSTGDAHVNALAVTHDGAQVVLAGATWDRADATQLALTGLSASNGSTLWSDAQGAAGPDQAVDLIASPTGDLFTTGTLTTAGDTQRSATLAYVPGSPDQGSQESQASTQGSSSDELPEALVAAYERLGHEVPETPEAAMDREIRPVPGAGMAPPVCISCTTGLDLSELTLDQPRQGPEDDIPEDVQIILNQTIPEDETVRLENGTVIVIGTIEVEGTLIVINTTLEFAPTSDGIFVKSTGLLLSQDAAFQATLGLSPASRAPFQVDVEAGGILNMQHTVVFGGQGVSSRSELTVFEHNLVQNNTVGLSMEDVEGPTIQSNTFLGNDAGMRLNQTNLTVAQNVFEFGISGLEDHNSTLNVANNDFVSMTWGILAESSEGIIDTNRFTDRHSPPGGGISVFDSQSPTIRNNQISAFGTGVEIENARAWVENNTLTDNVIAGISVDSNPAPMHIRDNDITLNAGQGILLTSTADVDVSRNLVDGNSEDGIRVEQSPSATISNNTVRASGIHGISIRSSPASIVQDNRLESSDAHGIVVTGDSGASRVLRNNVTGAHVKGLLVRGSASELVDNRITGALETGIAVRGDGVRVLRGQSFDNQGDGVQVAFASGVSIEQTRSKGNLGTGFALVLDEGTTIHQSEAKNNRDGATTLASTLAELTCTRLLDNAVDGVRTELGEPALVYNAWIEGNDVFGANNPSPSTMDARHSYWGASDGPSTLDGTGGSGDLVSENVQFEPFLTAPPSCGAGVDQGEASQSAEDQGLPTVNQEPTASFSASPSQPATGQQVSFTDGSSDPDGEIAAWSWDFGDGATSTQANPTHTYQDPGSYTVELEVTDDAGATDNATRVIEVVKTLPFADFKVHPAAPVETVQVSFTDDSEPDDAPIVSWSWDFGDGNTSTERHPEHTYAQAGTYTVELTVEDVQGRTSTRSQALAVDPIATTDSIGVAVSSPNVFAGKISHDEQPILSIQVRDDQGNPVENALIQATVVHRERGLTQTTELTPTSSAGLAQIVVPWDVSTGKQGTNLEGQHAVTVTAEARDSAGEPIETDARFNYVVEIDR